MEKIIGCDIDGCLNLFHKNLIEIAKNHFNLSFENENLVDTKIIEAMGFQTKEEKKYFFQKFDEETRDPIIFPGAKDVIDKLRNENFKIILVTARTYDIGKLTQNWLSKNGLEYDEILLGCGDKIDACIWKDIKFMIEDNPFNVSSLLDGGIKVAMPKHGYNDHLNHENLFKCDNWDDIYKTIKLHFN